MKDEKRMHVCFSVSKRMKKAIMKNTPSVLDALTLSAEEAVMREAKKAGIDLFSNRAVIKAIEPSESGEYYNVTFELVPKDDIIKIQLVSGDEKDVPLDIITEYGSMCEVKELPPCIPYDDPFPHYTPINMRFYIKVAPFDDIIYITPESLKEVAKQKEK